MPRPLPPSDAEKIEEVYIDETSQTGHRHLIIGGITFPPPLFPAQQGVLVPRGGTLREKQTAHGGTTCALRKASSSGSVWATLLREAKLCVHHLGKAPT